MSSKKKGHYFLLQRFLIQYTGCTRAMIGCGRSMFCAPICSVTTKANYYVKAQGCDRQVLKTLVSLSKTRDRITVFLFKIYVSKIMRKFAFRLI